jgi:hypothetical protein
VSSCSMISAASSSSFYAESIASFLSQSNDHILGELSRPRVFDITPAQSASWEDEIEILKEALQGIDGYLFLEFDVPRIGSRIDAVVISGGCIFVLEFKVGEKAYPREAINQVWDYALDLKNFHRASHQAPIVPILICTLAKKGSGELSLPFADRVYEPIRTNPESLPHLLRAALSNIDATSIDAHEWVSSPYQPTPTIIEAAQSLYSRHSVEAISRHDAGARNLAITSKRVEELIDQAARLKEKHIIFVTGVPGAGKTLVGLNVSTQRRDKSLATHAVFLSGNGPLVAVLSEALTKDEVARRKNAGERKPPIGKIRQEIKAFIQNIHHFRDEGIRDLSRSPSEHVVIFDEAQRAWNLAKTKDFMARRKGLKNFSHSEPEFLISYLDRHTDWAVIICLVGGGQEIYRGEAGIAEWLNSLKAHFPSWRVHVTPNLKDSEYDASDALVALQQNSLVSLDTNLHLSASMRSFRAESVSSFVKAVLDRDYSAASKCLASFRERYPIAVTRCLDTAKKWIRFRARGSERFGLVASSKALRLKPHSVDVRVSINPVHWFLNDNKDVRSSFYLEDPATEFQVQGLELDWVCVNWDADLRLTPTGWNYHSFVGDKWQSVRKDELKHYLLNAYRVLLTRARQGMVIFVPPGDSSDHTRPPSFYDHTFDYLKGIGIEVI